MSVDPVGGPAGGPAAVPVCPRHPDRESYVRCQRCERPTCPQCQRPAAVGIQCVDCVREQSRSIRTPRTVFGGAVRAGRPRVTQALIGACVIVYLLQILPGSSVTDRFSFVPFLALSEPWRLLTSAFLHSPGQPLHIAFNMYALWLTGPYLEALLGRLRFLALYLLSAFGGSVGYLLLADPRNVNQWAGYAVGASAAVFGLFGGLVVIQRRLGRQAGPIIGVIGVNAVLGFVLPSVAWQAHLGGLLTGLAVSALLAYVPQQRHSALQYAGMAIVLLGLVALIAVKIATLPAGALPA